MVKNLTPIQPLGGIGAPYLVILKNEILEVFRPFIQRSLLEQTPFDVIKPKKFCVDDTI